METWITIFLVAVLIIGLIVALAAICSVVLLGAGRRYRRRVVAEDAQMVARYLPGTDCGSCKAKTCRVFAEQSAWEGRLPEVCPYLSEQTRQEIDAALAKRETDLQNYCQAVKKADRAAGIEH